MSVPQRLPPQRRSQSDRYRLVAEFTNDIIAELDPDGHILWVSDSIQRVLGIDADLAVGTQARSASTPGQEALLADLEATLKRGEDVHDVEILLRVPKGECWFSLSMRVTHDTDGHTRGAVVALRDIDDSVRTRRALRASETMFRTSMMRNPNGMVMYSLTGRVLTVNSAFCAMTHRTPEWIMTHEVADILPHSEVVRALALFQSVASGAEESVSSSSAMLRPDGTYARARWTLSLIRDDRGNPDYIIGQYHDETPAFEARERLERLANFDGVTGLLSRGRLTQEIEVALERARSHDQTVGAIFIDIDGFRLVNDSLGHDAGDRLLRLFGERLLNCLPEGAVVGRLSGDEFLVVLTDVSDTRHLDRLGRALQARIAGPLAIADRSIPVSASIGAAVAGPDATAGELIRHADLAHHRAKSQGRSGRIVFDEEFALEAEEALKVQDDLRLAIGRHQLRVHYQPLVRLDDRSVIGHEALVRWQHPVEGLLPPARFLTVAEKSGLMVQVGIEVIDLVVAQLADGTEQLGRVAINLSAAQLLDPRTIDHLLHGCRDRGIDPGRMVVEITETSVLPRVDAVKDALRRIREAGAGIHMDDFGTGYSSISLLRDLPVTGLKLDRSFVTHLGPHGGTSAALAAGLAALAAGLGLDTVAEGIETESQAQLVESLGWEHGQGYLFGRPDPCPSASARRA